MNSKSMIHRDLKPENIVIINDNPNNFKVSLLDFGFVCWTNESSEILSAACGTPGFIAPEIFYDQQCSHNVNNQMTSRLPVSKENSNKRSSKCRLLNYKIIKNSKNN
jgi:serine/threonine protein kinase